MKKCPIWIGIVLISVTLVSCSAPTKDSLSWITLFNGNDLTGWSIVGSHGKAYVENGEIVCHMVSNTPEHTFVRTNEKYGDFVLEGDCKLEGNFHTGFSLRCVDAPKGAKVCLLGYQVKIDPTPRKWTGGIFDDFGDTWTWLCDLADNPAGREAFKMNQWNHFRIEAIGPEIKVWVNGIPTAYLIDTKYTQGYIALKIHSMGNTPENEKILVHYKNLRILTSEPQRHSMPTDLPAKRRNRL
jgi:hypothetical protein